MVFLCLDTASAKLQRTTNHCSLATHKRRSCDDVQLMLARLRIPEGSINLPSSARRLPLLISVTAEGETKLMVFSASSATR
jgi:hypothetical protein